MGTNLPNVTPIRDTAYLVGVLDTVTGKFLGADYFSEPNPTLKSTHFCFTIAVGRGGDYAEGLHHLRNCVETPGLAWVRPFLSERSR